MALFRDSVLLVALILYFSSSAWSMNGMYLDGYSPISQALGGAGMAIDTGTSGMLNNPATLSQLPPGNRIDLTTSLLFADIKWERADSTVKSDSKLFVLPSFGYVHNENIWSIGIGYTCYAGLGTDYLSDKAMPMFSQALVKKLMLPVAFKITEELSAGITLEYLEAGMDLVLGAFKFKDNSTFTATATGEGYTAKIGLLYKPHQRLHFGASYRHKGNISDLTGRGARVKGFDTPTSYGAGLALWLLDDLMLTMEYERILWSKAFRTITISQYGNNMDVPQHWDDQNIFSIGLAYKATPDLTLRIGANIANQAVKEHTIPLFPATSKNHYAAGFGYRFNEVHSVDVSYSYADKVTQDNSSLFAGTKTIHSEHIVTLMYSFKF